MREPYVPDLELLALLYRNHPRWALWLPLSPGGPWTAVRPAGSRPPGPGVPLLWVSAATAAELGERMRNTGTALKPGG